MLPLIKGVSHNFNVLQGFEARGTIISNRLRSYRRLINETDVWPPRWTGHGDGFVSDGQQNDTTVNDDESSDHDDVYNSTVEAGIETYFCGIPSK